MEQTHVINTVTHHNKSVKTDIYVEARVLIGIESCCTEDVRMRCTAGHDLDPAHVLTNTASLTAANKATHIDFKSGLNKREEARSHSYGNILTEDLRENTLDHNLTCSIGEVLINDKCLILEECTLMTGIGSFVSVNSTRIYKTVRRLDRKSVV